ncbi:MULTISPECIES: DUF4365 domain-containing protein [unclassified Streptomyces]|uniref:DUF4365 domain-containing protein n=1 Tax=unclassified Streptomyces TaxID=2593676 RepID=UPI001BEB2CD0|nr:MULTISPECIES: DUF4365 domain-containing protein [unclassified Streptomyces]MBT2403209.1 DUF4365 domain-containing protein [Streptomyces sp. ISL-21]MBT2458540.1 DUF4365 domain-containing protein [Streptomyces sp. ISL-86]MBT2610114.1 DUF4365 domain-containing protein [Streptomyces sp. ISL-87]
MSTVRSSRRIERAGVNALRSLLEENDHIVQEIDGGNDHGEDMIVNFTRSGRRTGCWIAIQVKSGKKYKRANGYAIPVEDHFDDWRQSRIPIIGVVYDMKKKELFWVNLTEQLRSTDVSPGWVQVSNLARLNADTVDGFQSEISAYAGDTQMRIRASNQEEAFTEAIRARQGLDPETAPNPLFEGMADFALRHEERLHVIARDVRRSIPIQVLTLIMVWEWPRQIRFVEGSVDMNPVPWVLGLYFFMLLMAFTIFFELRAGRRPKETGNWLIFVACNFLWLPFLDPDGDRGWWGTTWIVAGIVIPSFGIKLLYISFIGFARDRKKKHYRATF